MGVDIAQRHRGTLGGRLSEQHGLARVTISLDAVTSGTTVGQHLAWMLVNLLARQTEEVGTIEFDIPTGVTPIRHLSPLMPSDCADLSDCLRSGIERVNPAVLSRSDRPRTRISIRIGPGPIGNGDLALVTTAIGWAGHVGSEITGELGSSDNPIGAYLAACLTAGEVFKFIRSSRPESTSSAQNVWLDALTLRVSSSPPESEGPRPAAIPPSAVIVGAGAVANGLFQVLYALPQVTTSLILLDHDKEGITDSNLNRCVLFGLNQLGTLKASTAAHAFTGRSIIVQPVTASFDDWYAFQGTPRLDLVISAVDRNRSRHAIQDALPRLVLGASTNEMRAQVNLYDVLAGGPCLRCRNRPEAVLPDASVIEGLRHLESSERAKKAAAHGVEPAALDTYLIDPVTHCGTISGTTLQRFADVAEDAEWSVGFVSTLAGVLLAAEYLKRGVTEAEAMLTEMHNTFRFQFWRPERREINRITTTPSESGCLCQSPLFRSAMASVWS
ncbi:MAG: ThiF family adenylyltransferase [Thermomicrobiales bacterium]